jgi:hypothetical protein
MWCRTSDGRDALPRDPGARPEKVAATRLNVFADAAKRDVGTCGAGRAGAHPYRRRRRHEIATIVWLARAPMKKL